MAGLCLRGKLKRWNVQQKAEVVPLAAVRVPGLWGGQLRVCTGLSCTQDALTGHKLQPHCVWRCHQLNEVKYSEAPAPAPWTIEWSKCMCIFRIWRMKQQNCAKRNYIYLICSYRVGMEQQQRALDVSHLGRYVIIQGLAWSLWVIHQSHFKAGTAWWELSVPPERYLENSSWEWDSKRTLCSWRGISKLT